MKVGLVLEGGAMRGMYTAGVLDVMMDHNMHIDCIVGVSAGALFGVNYISKQRGRVIRYNKAYNHDKEYLGIIPLIKEGNIVSTEYAYERVPHELDPFDDETFRKSDTEFYAVVTEVETGLPEYMKIDSVFEQMDVLRSSGSMPFVSKAVEINGKKYLDGGISDSIPFRWLKKQGYDKIIVILTRDISYVKKPMAKPLTYIYKFKYPKISKRLQRRHYLYNHSVQRLCELERRGEAFVIRPSNPITVGKIESDPKKLQQVYELGIRDGNRMIAQLKTYLQETDYTE